MNSTEKKCVENKLKLLTGIQWLFLLLAISVTIHSLLGFVTLIVLSFVVSRVSYGLMVKHYGDDPFGEGPLVYYFANFF